MSVHIGPRHNVLSTRGDSFGPGYHSHRRVINGKTFVFFEESLPRGGRVVRIEVCELRGLNLVPIKRFTNY